jgi:hypothetical protein
MQKRKLIIGEYDTAFDGLWTLSALELSDPDYQGHFVDVPGRDGPLDLSTTLTDGEPRYGGRTLTATLEGSEGTRADREARIGEMVNALDGRRFNIVHPDYPAHYLSGRVQVKKKYSDPAHAAVTVTARCDPWLYFDTPTAYKLTAAEDVQTAVLVNQGRRTVAPLVTVTGGPVRLELRTGEVQLEPGTYSLPGLVLPSGGTQIGYSGSGVIEITYREAVLR